MGRTPDIRLKVSNSGQLLAKFKNIFKDNIDYFINEKYSDFLLPFKKIKGIDDNNLQFIKADLDSKVAALKDATSDYDIVVLYTLVISSIITMIRNIHFNLTIGEIKRRIMVKDVNVTENQIQKELDKLFMRNNKNVSILYNISYLDALAESFNYHKVARICKIQKGKYINIISRLITSSL